jgi:hypothetical protein
LIVPTFIVAGAPRCATTALHYYLQQHPQVCMSAIKEPNFFLFGSHGEPSIAEAPIIRKSVRRAADYGALYRPTPGQRAVGDASPLYLSTRDAAVRIAAMCGLIPIICLLRHPADRAWSHYLHAVPTDNHDDATEDFARLVRAEMARRPGEESSRSELYQTRTHLIRLGLYGDQIEWYQQVMGRENVHALLTEDLVADTSNSLEKLTQWIGVDHFDELPFEQVNESGRSPQGVAGVVYRMARAAQPTVKSILPPRVAGSLARRRARMTGRVVQSMPPLDPSLRAEITTWCAADVTKLEQLIDRDLSAWMAPRRPALIA